MQIIIENMEDLLTFELTETEKREIEKAKDAVEVKVENVTSTPVTPLKLEKKHVNKVSFITEIENKKKTSEKTSRMSISKLADIEAKTKDTTKDKKTRDKKTKNEKLVLDAFNDLYIMRRDEYVKQIKKPNEAATYTHAHYTLIDKITLNHLNQKETIAVFAGKFLTKFICFDVDSKHDLNYAMQLTKELIEVLKNTFKIDEKHIYVSYSGNKGYHVDVFFEEAIQNEKAKALYKAVMCHITPKKGTDIEFRPTFTQAVKPPLSKNLKTGNDCFFVNPVTFIPILDPLYIATIKKIPKLKIKELFADKELFTIETKKATEIDVVNSKVVDVDFSTEDSENQVVELLTKGYLQHEGTRNNMTFKSAIFLNQQGQTELDTVEIINGIMLNTWDNHRHMLDSETTLKKINEETARIVATVFKKNYGLQNIKKDIKIYKSEMEAVISIKEGHLRRLLYSFIIHSKKYKKKDGSFFFAYSTMGKMGNAKNRGSLLKYITELEQKGFVEIIQRGSKNQAMSREYNAVRFDTNIYRVTIPKIEKDPFIKYKSSDKDAEMYKTAQKLLYASYIKQNSTKDDWQKYIRKLYKK